MAAREHTARAFPALLALGIACGGVGAGQAGATYERDLGRGDVALRLGQAEDAADAYRAALDMRPGDPAALHGLARAHLAAGDGEAALAILARLDRGQPGRARERAGSDVERALLMTAEERLARGDSSGALRLLRRLREVDSGYPGLQRTLVEALFAEAGRLQVAGEPGRAGALVREAMGSEAEPADVSFALAVGLMERGRVDAAISVLSDALRSRPSDPRLQPLMDRALRIRYPNGLPD